MKTVRISVSRPYDIMIGKGLISIVPKEIDRIESYSKIVIVTDDVVSTLYLKELYDGIQAAGYSVSSFAIHNGEQSKCIDVLFELLVFLAEEHLDKKSLIIALGGGVVGDIAGFAASIYMRGISVIQVPTTLLSAVDSSVGGKTGINLRLGKNLVGSFWQPSMVACDVSVIERLPRKILYEGIAEVIKCGLLLGETQILGWIKQGEEVLRNHLEEVISECVSLKKMIVEQDEYDVKGIRNKLNLGHTIAHAIERLSNYTISHGHAVGTGIVIEAEMAQKLGICSDATVHLVREIVNQFELRVEIPWTSEEMVEAMKSDKKGVDGQIVFEFPIDGGGCMERKLETEFVKELIGEFL